MISSTFFFLFSQLGVGMMLTLLFISPRSIGNGFFKFASLTAAILLGVTLGFNFMFPSPARQSQLPVIFLFVAAMVYVPMAQVHQAVTGDYRAFFDVRFVWRLVRARLSAYVILAALVTLVSFLLEILKTAPAFFGDLTESSSDAEVLKMLQNYYLKIGRAHV